MAYATTHTLIPLDRVAFHLQIDPYHFNGIYTSNRPILPNCNDIWFQHDWQSSGKLSRESIALALKQAEDIVAQHLGFYPIACYIEDEEISFPSFFKPEQQNYSTLKTFDVNWGYVIDIGKKTVEVIQLKAPIVWLDKDNDGYFETGEVVVNLDTDIINEDEISIFYPNHSGEAAYEIRPINSIIINTKTKTVTIQFPRYLAAKEELIERAVDTTSDHLAIDGDNINNFLKEVDVYRVYLDKRFQIVFSSDLADTQNIYLGRVQIINSRLGILRCMTSVDTTFFNKVRINYFAGWRDKTVKYPSRMMWPSLERLIVFYALTFLDTNLCGCSNTINIWESQTKDLAKVTPQESYTVSWNLPSIGNPFGTTRAAWNLFNFIYRTNLAIKKGPMIT